MNSRTYVEHYISPRDVAQSRAQDDDHQSCEGDAAEAVAFVIGKAVGLKTDSASADYIHLYHGNASLLAESLEVIQQTSGVILAGLQPPTAAEAEMPDAELAKVA